MDEACLEHRLTELERRQFDQEGYLIVKNALPADYVAQLVSAVDRIDAQLRPQLGLGTKPLNRLDVIGMDDAFLPLLDWPSVLRLPYQRGSTSRRPRPAA